MVSNAMFRKAKEISNRGDVNYEGVFEGRDIFTVYRRDTDTEAVVAVHRSPSGKLRFYSTGKYFNETGKTDTYITAVRLTTGLPVIVE